MKIQLLTAVTIFALSATSAQAMRGSGSAPGGITNDSTGALAIGGETLLGSSSYYSSDVAYNNGGRAIAGSIYLEGDACACELGAVSNTSVDAVAIGSATAGSIHVNNTHGY